MSGGTGRLGEDYTAQWLISRGYRITAKNFHSRYGEIDIIAEDDGILDKIDLSIKSEQLYRFIGECLDEREITVIKHRYGLYGCAPRTQREVADKLGISRSYVSRIEKKALQTLKKKYDKTSIFSSSVHSGTSVSAGARTAKRKEKSDLK